MSTQLIHNINPESRRTTAAGDARILSVVMYVFRVSVSLFCGYPKSMISAIKFNKMREIKKILTHHR